MIKLIRNLQKLYNQCQINTLITKATLGKIIIALLAAREELAAANTDAKKGWYYAAMDEGSQMIVGEEYDADLAKHEERIGKK